ncbi:MAG TPA: hypothetical protein VLB83_01425 [Candidatus Paceibacterota bacterium]|nr:hypothetical protein [Candidatus Paceibacterota bacterium]
MKLFLISSKRFYDRIPEIQSALEAMGHAITLPNCYDDPATEARYRELGSEEHAKWKAEMFAHSAKVIAEHDAVLVLNFERDGMENYIGGATFLEMYDAFKLGKRIFLYNPIPAGMLADEIAGFAPVVILGDLKKVL